MSVGQLSRSANYQNQELEKFYLSTFRPLPNQNILQVYGYFIQVCQKCVKGWNNVYPCKPQYYYKSGVRGGLNYIVLLTC